MRGRAVLQKGSPHAAESVQKVYLASDRCEFSCASDSGAKELDLPAGTGGRLGFFTTASLGPSRFIFVPFANPDPLMNLEMY